MDELRICVLGAGGRMGSFATGLIEAADGFRVTGALDRDDDLAAGLRASEATVGLDLTVAGRGFEHGLLMLLAGVRPVIGTSGVSLEQNTELDARARALGLGGLVVPNFSLGVWFLQRAAADAARTFDHAEIIEEHHAGKPDAPSGTALDTAERIASARRGTGSPAEDEPARGRLHHGVPIHAVRLPGRYAHQEVLFSGPGETLTLRHDMLGPEAFGPGILAALRFAATADGVGRGIGRALGEP